MPIFWLEYGKTIGNPMKRMLHLTETIRWPRFAPPALIRLCYTSEQVTCKWGIDGFHLEGFGQFSVPTRSFVSTELGLGAIDPRGLYCS